MHAKNGLDPRTPEGAERIAINAMQSGRVRVASAGVLFAALRLRWYKLDALAAALCVSRATVTRASREMRGVGVKLTDFRAGD